MLDKQEIENISRCQGIIITFDPKHSIMTARHVGIQESYDVSTFLVAGDSVAAFKTAQVFIESTGAPLVLTGLVIRTDDGLIVACQSQSKKQ